MAYSNPVVEVYRGIEIRKYPDLHIRIDQFTMKEIIDAMLDTDMNIRQVLGYSAKCCSHCIGTKVEVYNKHDQVVEIKKGILSKRIPKK